MPMIVYLINFTSQLSAILQRITENQSELNICSFICEHLVPMTYANKNSILFLYTDCLTSENVLEKISQGYYNKLKALISLVV